MQEQAKEDLESGAADIILQVNQLGEGYDHPSLSIAVLFCIPRCIGPYWQFVGRTTRIIKVRGCGW
jgi:superfamily II DNA or RNA helicase